MTLEDPGGQGLMGSKGKRRGGLLPRADPCPLACMAAVAEVTSLIHLDLTGFSDEMQCFKYTP